MIKSRGGWVLLSLDRPESFTWLPQPGWRGVTQRVRLFTWSLVLYLGTGKTHFDLPWSFSRMWWWVDRLSLWPGSGQAGSLQYSTPTFPTHRIYLRSFTSHFQSAEGVCLNQSTSGSSRMALAVSAGPKLEEIRKASLWQDGCQQRTLQTLHHV